MSRQETGKTEANRDATDPLSLSALLSQTLVAFTIECDNEMERLVPHRTTRGGGSRTAPWLVSHALWANFLRFVGHGGTTVGELDENLRVTGGVRIWLERMENWWGYVTVVPDPADTRQNPPRSAWRVKPTAGGARACDVWERLGEKTEARWRQRFGADSIDRLRAALIPIVEGSSIELPAYMPIVGYGLFSEIRPIPLSGDLNPGSEVADLSVLLSRALLLFTLAFEERSDVSLSISSNLLRVLRATPLRMRDLPDITGVSKESIEMAVVWLNTKRYTLVDTDLKSGRTKRIRLTESGLLAQERYLSLLAEIETDWRTRYGTQAIDALYHTLEPLVGQGEQTSPLFACIEPEPECWRAKARPPQTLPWQPMVLHRGGYPDGA